MTEEGGRTLGLGILSAANIAKKNVRAILKNDKGLEVVAVASRSLSKAEKFIKETGLEGRSTAYGSYEELLKDPKVHAVYVPLPAGVRIEWIKKATKAGKHIMSEKPIALTAEATDEAIDACQAANLQWMDGTMWLHNPRARYIKEILSNENLIGSARSVLTSFTCDFASDEKFMQDVRSQKDLDGLGCLGDIGWYCLSKTLWAFNYDPPSLVQAQPGAKYNANQVFTHVAATLVWDDGRRAIIDCGFDRCLSQLIQVTCTKGLLQWQDFCIPNEEDSCEFTLKGSGSMVDLDTHIEQSVEQKKVYLQKPQECSMWETFAQCIYDIQDGKPPDQHWPRISRLTNKLVVAIAESAENNCTPIKFPF